MPKMTSYQNRSKKTDKEFQGRIRISTKLRNLTLFFFFSIKVKLSRHTERIENFFSPLTNPYLRNSPLRPPLFSRARSQTRMVSLSFSLSYFLSLSLSRLALFLFASHVFFSRSHPRAIPLSPLALSRSHSSRYLALTLALSHSLLSSFRRHATTKRFLGQMPSSGETLRITFIRTCFPMQ